MKNLKCPHCKSCSLRKRGFMKTKRGKTARYECKDCSKTFTKRTGTLNYRKRKQELRDKITTMYCERMSLRGIARTLNIDIKTAVRYFLENAESSKIKNLNDLEKGKIITSYLQFDQLETFEHTKRKPVGVQISIRHKTGEIVSAKVGYAPMRALSVSKDKIIKWNREKASDKNLRLMIKESRKALNKTQATITCDGYRPQLKLLKDLVQDSNVSIQESQSTNKKIDRVFRKMRQDISRLGRKTLSTTKKIDNLQRHLDLYIDYNNNQRLA